MTSNTNTAPPGAQVFRLLPTLSTNITSTTSQPGWSLELYDTQDFSSKPRRVDQKEASIFNTLGESYDFKPAAVKLRGTFKPTTTGHHYLGASGLGPTQLFVNGTSVSHQTGNHKDFMGFLLGGGEQQNIQHAFEAGTDYEIHLTSLMPQNNASGASLLDGVMGFYLGFMPQAEHDADVLSTAVALAESADAAIVFTGHTPEWETEGQDQKSFHLPAAGSQDALVAAVAKANKRTVVVNSTGTPVALPWLADIPALLQTWFPGQEAGNAIADVLTGAVVPSGKLPTSFPKHIRDAPAYGNFPGEYKDGRLEVEYKEGVFIGYRHYDRVAPETLNFPFGFGLSYTDFSVSDLAISQSGADASAAFAVSVNVKNTGAVAGAQVVQVYAGPEFKASVDVPVKALVGFGKVYLEPGESGKVEVAFEARQLAYFDEGEGEWVVEKGKYTVFVGTSARDIVLKGTVAAQERMAFKP